MLPVTVFVVPKGQRGGLLDYSPSLNIAVPDLPRLSRPTFELLFRAPFHRFNFYVAPPTPTTVTLNPSSCRIRPQ